jgi:MFS transporter, Spinster family, sphingosine-1-phosphate transporter
MSEISPGLKTVPRIKASYARYVFWVMFSISFMNYLDRSILSGAINVIAKELHFGLEGIGFISSAFLIIYTLGILPLGLLADRMARKNVVASTLAAWSVITALTAVSANFAMLFVSRMLLGIGEAGYFPAGTALMSDYYSREKRSRIMSWWSVAQVFGILFGTAIGGIVAGLYTGAWRLAFIFTGIPGLLLAFLAWRLREPKRNQADEEAAEIDPSFTITEVESEPRHIIKNSQGIITQIQSLFRIKTLIVLTVMQIFAFFVVSVNLTFLPTYLQQKDTFGLSSGKAGLLAGIVIALAGMAGTIAGGYLADALTRRNAGARVLICGIGFLLSAPCFVVAITTRNLLLFIIAFVVTTILLTFYQGPSTAATQDIAPSFLRATAVSTVLLIAHLLGDAFSPSIVSVLASALDPTHGLHFKNALAGHDLTVALLVTCTPALVIAGLVGTFGARWMGADVAAAEQADLALKEDRAPVA